MAEKIDWTVTPHDPDPTHSVGAIMDGDKVILQSGDWACYKCRRPLKGTYLRPVIPWEHRPSKASKEGTDLPGLGTTE